MADRDLRIRMLLEAADRVTKPLKDIAGGAGRASTALKATRDRLREIERVQGDVEAFRKLKSGLATTTEAMEAARQRATQLGRDLAATETPTRAMAREFASAKREAEQLTRQHQAESRELTTIRGRLTEVGVSTRHLAAAEQALAADARHTNAELKEQTERLEQLQSRSRRFGAARGTFGKGQEMAGNLASGGAAALGTGIGTGMVVASVAKDAMNMEDVMADVRKVVNFDDQAKSMERLKGQVIGLSTVMPITAEGFGQIVAAAGRSGIAEDDLSEAVKRNGGRQLDAARADLVRSNALMQFGKDAAKMSIAFDMTAEDAGTTMATWRSAFNIGSEGVTKLGNQVNALTNTYGGNVAGVVGMVTRVGPLGAIAGTASGQIAALAQRLARLGIEEEVGATGIKNLLLSLTRGAAATPKMSAAFKQLGLDTVDVSKRMQKDAGGTMLDVFHRLAKLDASVRPGVLTRMFGKESIEPIAALLNTLPDLEKNFALVADQQAYAGSMEREYASRSKTTSNAVQLANNNFTALKITIGTTLLPTIGALAARLGRVFGAMRNFAAQHPTMTRGIMVMAGAVALVLTVLGALGIALAAIVGPFAAVAAIATYFEMAMLPVIGIAAAVVLGIALLAGAAYLIYAKWGAVAGWFAGMWSDIKQDVSGGLGGIAALLVDFNPLGLIYRSFAAMLSWLGVALPARLSDAGRMLIHGLISGITGALGALKAAVVGAASSAATWFREKMGIHSPSRVFAGFGGYMMQGLTNGIADNEDAPVRRLDRLSRRVQAAIATGAAVGSITGPAAANSPASAAPAARSAAHGPITIHVHAAPGQDEQAIARAVAKALADEQARQGAAGRSSYADAPDWE